MESKNQKLQLPIKGMTCVNCQNKIEKKLYCTEGIVSARVSFNKGTADIVYDKNKITVQKIIAVIEGLDYEVIKEKEAEDTDLGRTIGILIVIAALYVLLQSMDILNLLVPSQLADTKMGYGMLFVIGLLTSVHCVAMCGGINLSQCIPQTGQNDKDSLRPALAYNIGRVVSYTAVGFVLGGIGFMIGGGAEVGLPVLLQGILKIVAGLFMVIMGLNMLGLFPGLRKFMIRMPKVFARKIGKEKARRKQPFLVGVLNGFMPCGPLQSMWVVALATCNPLLGALSMLLFSLGTVPLMLGLGTVVSILGRKFTDKVMMVGAVLVVVLGLAMLSQGGTLSGWISPDLLLVLIVAFGICGVILNLPAKNLMWKNLMRSASLVIIAGACVLWNLYGNQAGEVSASGAQADMEEGVQVVNSTLVPGTYPNITVQAGVPVKWVIQASEDSINGCNYKMLIQDYGIEHTFQPGENVIEFTPTETGTVRYSCWMGMIHGNIFVTDNENEDAASADSAASGSDADSAANDSAANDSTANAASDSDTADTDRTGSTGEISNVPVPADYEIPTENLAIASITEDENDGESQEVSISLNDEGFSPAVIVVQSDLPVVWNIENTMTDAQDGTTLLVPYYSTELSLEEGQNRLSFSPTDSFDVSTGDNRFYCYVKVVEDLGDFDENEVREEVASYETLIYPKESLESSVPSCCQ